MGFVRDAMELPADASDAEHVLTTALLLQEQLSVRLALLAMHSSKEAQVREPFFALVATLLAVLQEGERAILPADLELEGREPTLN